jgi:hypothetical protein
VIEHLQPGAGEKLAEPQPRLEIVATGRLERVVA